MSKTKEKVIMRMNKVLASVASLMLVLSPLNVYAEDSVYVYATDANGNNYSSIESAWSAAQNGTSITLTCDWELPSRLVLDEGKEATLELAGHKITRNLISAHSNGEVIMMKKKSKLHLNGKVAANTEFSYLSPRAEYTHEESIISGGLICGGYSTNGAGGIHMKEGSSLELDGVSIAGNQSEKS